METKYFVARAFRYKASGNWEYSLVGAYDELSAAKQAYYSNMGSIIKSTNDFAMVILYDSYGNKIMADYDSTYVAPEPPEPNE